MPARANTLSCELYPYNKNIYSYCRSHSTASNSHTIGCELYLYDETDCYSYCRGHSSASNTYTFSCVLYLCNVTNGYSYCKGHSNASNSRTVHCVLYPCSEIKSVWWDEWLILWAVAKLCDGHTMTSDLLHWSHMVRRMTTVTADVATAPTTVRLLLRTVV